MKEIWKQIPGYPNYMASNLGNIKSLNYKGSRQEKILKPTLNAKGYYQLSLSNNGIPTKHKVHRLVAYTFLPNPNNYPHVNHKDEDKTNNAVSNLEWCDVKYNNNYGTHNERVANANSIPIIQFTVDGKYIMTWKSGTEVERIIGVSSSSICACCKGKKKTAGKSIWKKVEDIPVLQTSFQLLTRLSPISKSYTHAKHS